MKIVRYTNIRSMFGMISLMLCLLIPCVAVAQDDEGKKDEKKTVVPKRAKLSKIDNPDAAVRAFRQVAKVYDATPPVIELANDIMRQHKKNPDVATGIANAFFYNTAIRDSSLTMEYVNKSIDIDKTYAPAYLVAGELMEYKRDTLAAAKWYEDGVAANPKYPNCYLSYIKLMSLKDISKSEAMFNKLRTALPDFPAYLEISKFYEALGDRGINQYDNYKIAVEYLEKEKPENLTKKDWYDFAVMSELQKNPEYSLDICKRGLQIYPDFWGLNRCASRYSFYLKRWEDSQKYYEDHKYRSDSVMIEPTDVLNYAKCFQNRKNYTKAIACFKEYMAIDSITEDQRFIALDPLGECYKEMGDYDLARKAYIDLAEHKRANGKPTFFCLYPVGQIYETQASECFGDEKLMCYSKADSVYLLAANENLDFAEVAYLYRWQLNTAARLNRLDVCVESAEQILIIYKTRDIHNFVKRNIPMLYGFLCDAYSYGKEDAKGNKVVKQNLMKADEYCNKWLELEPNNPDANEYRKAIDKSLSKSRRRR